MSTTTCSSSAASIPAARPWRRSPPPGGRTTPCSAQEGQADQPAPQTSTSPGRAGAAGARGRTGQAPPKAARLEIVAPGNPGEAPKLVPDAQGNAKGGIRTPRVDTPTAKMSGFGNVGGPYGFLVGTTEPFDAATLSKLYPGGKADYLKKFDASLARAVKGGFILKADESEIRALAAANGPGNSAASLAPRQLARVELFGGGEAHDLGLILLVLAGRQQRGGVGDGLEQRLDPLAARPCGSRTARGPAPGPCRPGGRCRAGRGGSRGRPAR